MDRLPGANKLLIPVIAAVCAVAFVAGNSFVLAQTDLSGSVKSYREKLREELKRLEAEMAGYQELINQKKQEASTFKRDIDILNAKISKARTQVRAINVSIQSLSNKIGEKESSIISIAEKVEREKLSLAESLRTIREYDDHSLVEIILGYDQLSDFLGDVDAVDTIQRSIGDSFDELRRTKKLEELALADLVDKKHQADELKELRIVEKGRLESNENKKRGLLKIVKGEESKYRKGLAVNKRDAATIRSRLFLLQGSPSIPFEKAVEYAGIASKKTGVRIAFVLGVIAQESELGKNIGQCNLRGDPPRRKWKKIMKPSRDIKPYLDITGRLGLDPDLMPLSCPMSVGWGGAMGPAQFIPSTWLMFESRIAAATGHNPPSPWEPIDAFMASAIYLSDLGANTKSGEFKAAARYFAGGNWNTSLGRTYANQVLVKVETYQDQIDIISRY